MRMALAVAAVALLPGCLDFSSLVDCQSPWMCEGFEAGALDTSVWDTIVSGTKVMGAVESGGAHGGSYALTVSATADAAGSAQWVVQWPNLPTTADSETFVRAFVRVDSAAPAPFQLFNFRSTGATPAAHHLNLDGSRLELKLDSGANAAATQPFPIGRWTCLEWELKQAEAGWITVWTDELQVLSWAGKTTAVAPFTRVTLGASSFAAAPGDRFDVRFDDVVVAGRRIGCGTP